MAKQLPHRTAFTWSRNVCRLLIWERGLVLALACLMFCLAGQQLMADCADDVLNAGDKNVHGGKEND